MTGRTFPQSSTRTIHRRPGSSRMKEYFFSEKHSPTEERENRYREDACNTGIGDREEGDDRDSDVDDDIQVDAEEDFDTPPNTSLAHLLVVAYMRLQGNMLVKRQMSMLCLSLGLVVQVVIDLAVTQSVVQRLIGLAMILRLVLSGRRGLHLAVLGRVFQLRFSPHTRRGLSPIRPLSAPVAHSNVRVQRTAKPSLERSLAENNPDNSFIKAGYREFISACEARAKLLRAQAEKALKDANQQELLAHQATRVLARQFPASSDDKKVDPPQPGSGGQDPV
ncbi:hypothetical protein J3E72DRAFT_271327 [Bipolaris maydis]|nr:hypothetical protein J3E72DRAFT_271327 [Bipolaris maydis]